MKLKADTFEAASSGPVAFADPDVPITSYTHYDMSDNTESMTTLNISSYDDNATSSLDCNLTAAYSGAETYVFHMACQYTSGPNSCNNVFNNWDGSATVASASAISGSCYEIAAAAWRDPKYLYMSASGPLA